METILDRELQKQILTMLSSSYPYQRKAIEQSYTSTEKSKFFANVMYLHEHGLIEANAMGSAQEIRTITAEITAKGMDFLAGDGGLSAILGVVTVRLHDETIRDLIELSISQSDRPPSDKKKLIDGLRSLPADSIKHLTMELISKGLDKSSEALPLIQRCIEAVLG
jgi:hypothetical protein